MTNHSPKDEGTTVPAQSSVAQPAIDFELPLAEIAQAAGVTAVTDVAQSSSVAIESVVLIDAKLISVGKMPHRSDDAYSDEEFENLLDSIEAVKGNTQPISVIQLTEHAVAGHPYQYEVVSGSRRVRACQLLDLPVRAIVLIQPRTSSYQLDTILENLHRRDLSPLEFGRQIKELERTDPSLSLKKLARMVGRDKSVISRAKDLADLPNEVLTAFPSGRDIRFADGQPLKKALEVNREAVLKEALRLRDLPEKLKASEVVQHLVQAGQSPSHTEADEMTANVALAKGVAPCNPPVKAALEIDGKRVAQITHDKQGRLAINFELDINNSQQEALFIQLENFMRRRVMRLPANPAYKRTKDKSKADADEAVNSLDAAMEDMVA